MLLENLKHTLEDETQNELCLKELKFVAALDFPNDKNELDELFKEYISKTLIIDDFEPLNELQKHLLLDSVTSDGYFWYF